VSSEAYTRLAGVYDEIVVDPCYADWAAFLHRRWSLDPRGVSSVLDIACGTGLLAAELAPLGYRVVGTDASAAMLERARTLLGPEAELVCESLPTISVAGPFDAAVSTFDGLNYLTPDEVAATFVSVAEHLRPGGWLVFDLHTDAMMEFTAAHPDVRGEDAGQRFEITSDVDLAARSCRTRITVTRLSDGDVFEETHRQWFFGDEWVRGSLARAGFDRVEVLDEYSETPADDRSLRATWVARRPD
jgi:SAM-dependent methyltransferase